MANSEKITPDTPAGPQLYQMLRHRVLTGDLRPGERLSESEIAQVYGVSRQPVREAFIRMAGDGLIEIRPQRGSYIRRISRREVQAAQMIRESVEVEILRLAITGGPPGLGQDLLNQIVFQQDAAVRRDHDRFFMLDDEFHHMLARAVGREAVSAGIEGLNSQMNRLRYLNTRRADLSITIEDHRMIAQSIVSGDVEAGTQAMRLHMHRALDDLPIIRQAQPDYFID